MEKATNLGCLIALYLCGFISGMASTSKAGIISHAIVYEVGKHNGKDEAQEECKCPEKK